MTGSSSGSALGTGSGSGSGVIDFDPTTGSGAMIDGRRMTITSPLSDAARCGESSRLLRDKEGLATLTDEAGKPFVCLANPFPGLFRLPLERLVEVGVGSGRSSRSGEFDSSYETFLRDRVDLVEVDGTGESDFLGAS